MRGKRHRGWVAALAVIGTLSSFRAMPQKGNPTVTPIEAVNILKSDAARLLAGERQALDAAEMRLAGTSFRGLAILAPPRIEVAGELPVVIVSQSTTLHAWQVPEASNRLLVAQDFASGEVRVARTVIDLKADGYPYPPATRPPAPSGSAAAAITTGATRHDAQAALALPRRQGALALAVIEFDQVSNVARVEIAHGADPMPPGAPAIFPLPGDRGLPAYEVTPSNPSAPPDGVAFKFESVAARPGLPVIHGSFVKMAMAADLLSPPGSLQVHGSKRQVVAVVRMALVMLGLNQPVPRIFQWGIPLLGAGPVAVGNPLRGQFSINVLETAERLIPGHYVGYIFMAGSIHGPVRFNVE